MKLNDVALLFISHALLCILFSVAARRGGQGRQQMEEIKNPISRSNL